MALGCQHRWEQACAGTQLTVGAGVELVQKRALELGTGTRCLYQGWAGTAMEHFCGVRGNFPELGDGTDRQEVRIPSGLFTQLTLVPLCSPEAAG